MLISKITSRMPLGKAVSIFFAGAVLFVVPVSAQDAPVPEAGTWYRLVTMYNGTDARLGRCIQYFPEGSAHNGMIWSADPVDASDPAYDYQFWRFEAAPDNPKIYALVCKGVPDGYLSADPTSFSPEGRWLYIANPATETPTDKYEFELGGLRSGVDADSGEVYSDIFTDEDKVGQYKYINCAGEDQDYAINVGRATAPYDTNEWVFRLLPRQQVSGVTTVSVDTADSSDQATHAIYDLFGRQVANPDHGIYIVDGRKMVF